MSVDATRWAWKQKGISSVQKLVLLSLADRASADQFAYPSHDSIVEDTGADIKSVKAALRALVDLGLIEDSGHRAGRTKQVVVWHLVGVEDRTESSPKTEGFQKRKGSVFPVKGTQKRATEPKRELPDVFVGEAQPLPFTAVMECLHRFASEAPKHNASEFHAGVFMAMQREGWDAIVEAPVSDRGDGRTGKVDILVRKPCVIGVELDRASARAKSITKLSKIDGYRVVMLRESTCNLDIPGIDAVIGCASDDGFAAFWNAYPRKVAKATAQKAWSNLKPTPALVAEIMEGVKRGVESVEWSKDEGQYIPHPTTFLNGHRWTDEFKAKPPGATNQTPGASSSTARSMRGHYEQNRNFDKSAVARTRRDCERWAAEQASLFGADESGSILEGEFDTIPLHPSMATHG